MGAETLKPCPWCESDDLRLLGLQIVCFGCSMRGPSGMLPHPTPLEECRAEAARLWNALPRRVPPQEGGGDLSHPPHPAGLLDMARGALARAVDEFDLPREHYSQLEWSAVEGLRKTLDALDCAMREQARCAPPPTEEQERVAKKLEDMAAVKVQARSPQKSLVAGILEAAVRRQFLDLAAEVRALRPRCGEVDL